MASCLASNPRPRPAPRGLNDPFSTGERGGVSLGLGVRGDLGGGGMGGGVGLSGTGGNSFMLLFASISLGSCSSIDVGLKR